MKIVNFWNIQSMFKKIKIVIFSGFKNGKMNGDFYGFFY